jgi:membrane protease subunit (stomatin/prohibitin family)
VETVAQSLSIPGNFEYYLSVWARTAGTSSVTLTASTTGASQAVTFPLAAQWQRVGMLVGLGQATSSVTFAAQLAPGASVDLFGMQVDAQPAPASYRQTGVAGGVYASARFSSDQMMVTAQGTDVYDITVRIMTNGY